MTQNEASKFIPKCLIPVRFFFFFLFGFYFNKNKNICFECHQNTEAVFKCSNCTTYWCKDCISSTQTNDNNNLFYCSKECGHSSIKSNKPIPQ